jgi:hypothetical protein
VPGPADRGFGHGMPSDESRRASSMAERNPGRSACSWIGTEGRAQVPFSSFRRKSESTAARFTFLNVRPALGVHF